MVGSSRSSLDVEAASTSNFCYGDFVLPHFRQFLFFGLGQKKYIMKVHGFEESNITVLMDDGNHTPPTKDNMIAAYKQVVAESKPGDAIFLHYSGHGSKVADSSGDEDDGYDEVLVPLDFQDVGMIADDDLYDILVEALPQGVHVVSLVRTAISIGWPNRILCWRD